MAKVFGGASPMLMQQNPRWGRQYQLAQLLQQQGTDTSPVDHPTQALARIAQAFAGKRLGERVEGAFNERQQGMTDTMARALQAGQTAKPFTDPDTGQVAQGTQPTNVMAQQLMGNPDTAGMGMQFQMGQMGREQELANALRLAREKQKREPPKSRTVKRDGVEVMEQYDPATRTWSEVGSSGIGLIAPEAEAQKARIAKAGKAETNINVDLSKGQVEADKKAATEYNRFILQGGAADMEKNIAQLRTVREQLKSGDSLTGPFLGQLPKAVRSVVNPASVNAQELVEEVVQRNLREVLGAQFTEKEGMRLIERAYNPALDEKTNAERLERLIGAIEKTYASKLEAAKYFEQNGTLKGYTGTTRFTMDDIAKDAGLTEEKPQTRDFSTMPATELFQVEIDSLKTADEINAYRDAIRRATQGGR